ncbi:hypothetical protein SO802_006135 [Lithocarpus litseifolius]|uniref:Uncharacterized protein n=1 Tax=Lithocarpus litseifolius TaxID=425828 RepID=A0AAW2DMK6_9ROSI
MTFNADSIVNPISLVSFIESQGSDHVFNGLGIMSSFVSLFWTQEKLQIGVLLSFICILFYFILFFEFLNAKKYMALNNQTLRKGYYSIEIHLRNFYILI